MNLKHHDIKTLNLTVLSELFFFVALRFNAGHGLLILEVSRSHTTTHHSRKDFSGRVISPSQRLLPDNTQHPTQKDILAVGGIPTRNPSQRAALDRAATGIGIALTLVNVKVTTQIYTPHTTFCG